MTTDRAPSMIGNKTGLMSRIRQEVDKQNPEFYMELQCIIHQQSFCGKTLKSKHVMKVVVSVVNFIPSHGLNTTNFNLFFFLAAELMMNMGMSCTTQKSDGSVMGQCYIFFSLEVRNERKRRSCG
jgi:hypothetical protein